MFTKTKNIDTAFQSFRSFSIIVVVSSVIICAFVVHTCFRMVAKVESRIYILANGKALEAVAADRRDNIPVEARDHIRTFHELFFTLDPDEKVIQSNLSKAIYLADQSAKIQYESLKENGYYSGIIAGNISQEIEVDSIHFDMESYPYGFRCSAIQKIIRPSTIVIRSLTTEGVLRNVSRSDHNSHGFLIEKWKIIENKDISSLNR
ncbi:conjugative transposon protein TraK [Segetibacter sp. 3557_3]|uniref:conjugative transposon protein TraK n=1 Tax=Segetibacter sp. 3557_3 TaxID=2547429 RepID=UPI001058D939|nr:conjugative transposon protein TraK [Segetibacter sp. 3557_3]TDH18157.1 conjugative transposon protein TraK [Segetibacter sp. 3557_3]